ncbi:MAG: hypothetical protein LPK19_05265 [Hymenobacteraceae bacterium]|nr:hypothetical protein [Hymenobacteraceae bacterium]MDX5395606.1 hypothetical protein [Hymenobacteraceae bacterium]MDX5511660.1 hypothetical protein [Hymenobacteraceae bacterium]
MLRHHMQGELNNLLRLMHQLQLQPPHISDDDLKETLLTWLALFPVYRLYGSKLPLSGEDDEILHQTLNQTEQRKPHLQPAVQHLRLLFTNNTEAPGTEENRLNFLMRCQQFTGPLAAKGVEDTTFYHYNRLISHNEVGDSPDWFGITPQYFHERMLERKQYWPQAQNATATHDTKRGEDARIGLNVLSEMADEWEQAVMQWRELNQKFVYQNEDGKNVPSRNDEYFLYQALLAAYPMSGELERDLLPRLKQHMTKAIREAKVRSDWGDPNEDYEKGVHQFIDKIFSTSHGFREAIKPVLRKLSHYGMFYSLGQLLLKCSAPGVPDIYQGCELWELSMVDPDNRRPVEYELRQQYLNELQEQFAQQPLELINQLKANWTDGRIKQFVLWQVLQLRQQQPELFSEGRYIPLEISGSKSSHMIAFARQYEQQWCVVLVPHELVNLVSLDEWPLGEQVWQNAAVQLPADAPVHWKSLFDTRSLSASGSISVAEALQQFPVAVLMSAPEL